MFRRSIPAVALVPAFGWMASFAQPPAGETPKSAPGAKVDPKAPKTDPATFELRMEDDTVLKVVLLEQSVTLTTRYGKLVVPVADIRRLEFGFRYPDGVES